MCLWGYVLRFVFYGAVIFYSWVLFLLRSNKEVVSEGEDCVSFSPSVYVVDLVDEDDLAVGFLY